MRSKSNPVTSTLLRFWKIVTTHGPKEACLDVRNRILRKLGFIVKRGHYYYSIPNCRFPVCARLGTSDSQVFRDVFGDEQYGTQLATAKPQLIIDCGANVGYAAVFFLNRYPDAHIIAVEPDPANIAICAINLAPYKGRFTLMESAIWSHKTGLKIKRGSFRDGAEWAIQVSECEKGESPDIKALSIGDILGSSAFPQVDILKVDIERSETVIFAHYYQSWLPAVKNIMIELHDDECRRVFFSALADYDFERIERAEITVCQNLQHR